MFIVYPLRLSFGISQLTAVEYVLCNYHIKVLVDAYCGDIDGMECLASITLHKTYLYMRVGTLIVATTRIYLQLIQNRYMFRSFTLLQCSHQHCVQPVASDVEVVGYL